MAPSGCLHCHQQLLGHLHAAREADRGADAGSEGNRRRHPGAPDRRQRHHRRTPGIERSHRTGAQWRRADRDRSAQLPHGRPHHGRRCFALSQGGAGQRRVETRSPSASPCLSCQPTLVDQGRRRKAHRRMPGKSRSGRGGVSRDSAALAGIDVRQPIRDASAFAGMAAEEISVRLTWRKAPWSRQYPWRRPSPGSRAWIPTSPARAYWLLVYSVAAPDPLMFFEPTRLYRAAKEDVEDNGQGLPMDVCFVLREGKDVTLVSWGAALKETLGAAQQLENQGISAEVIDVATVSPIDFETILASVEKTGRLVID